MEEAGAEPHLSLHFPDGHDEGETIEENSFICMYLMNEEVRRRAGIERELAS